MRNLCQVTSCAASASVYFKMYDDFILNYNYVVNPLNSSIDYIMLKSTTKEGYYYVDQDYIVATPALQPTALIMPSPQIIRTNNVISRKVDWIFSFSINRNPIPPGGYMTM